MNDTPATVEACHDWITPEEASQHALAAFQAVREYLQRQDGTCKADGYRYGWSRQEFSAMLAEVFEARIEDQGFKRGIDLCRNYETLAWWLES